MDTTENQYSIYKVNYEQVEDIFEFKSVKDTPEYTVEVMEAILNSSIKLISEKKSSIIKKIKYNSFQGVFFKTIHDPSWNYLANYLLKNNSLEKKPSIADDFMKNTNISYILFYIVNKNIFVMTGGYGSNYITKFIEKNFGLYLIPKIFSKDNSVVKLAMQNSLTGNQASSQHANRIPTSFNIEKDMSNIFRQLGVEANHEIAQNLGIQFEEGESQDKKVNILNKDSIVIRRSVSLSQLVIILKKIEALEKLKDKFALNYIVLAKKKGLKNPDLFQTLIDDIVCGKTNQFVLVGDDYQSYYVNANTYRLIDTTTKNILINQTSPITFNDVLNNVQNNNIRGINKSSVIKMLKKYEVSTYDNCDNLSLSPIVLFDSLQGYIEFGVNKIPCFLFNGMWYVIDKKYEEQLDDDFNAFINNTSTVADKISKEFLPQLNESNEDDYNKKLLDYKEIIVAHTVLDNYIEIADAIFYDDNNIYFMHNKSKFNGIGSRDVTNQVLTASEYFQRNIMQADKVVFLKNYYLKINQMYQREGKNLHISETEFIQILSSERKKNYIVGYMESFSESSKSNYAKYLSVELQKKINAKGYGLYILSLK